MGCSIDWPLTFEGFKTFSSPLSALAWPIAILVGVLLFQSQLKALIGRVKSAKGAGFEFQMNEAQQVVPEKLPVEGTPSPLADGGRSGPLEDVVYTKMDHILRDWLDANVGADCETKLAWAIRRGSIAEAARMHEANYRMIFGSQIKALRALNNVESSPSSQLLGFFGEAVADPVSAQIHHGRTFDQWMNFLIGSGYVEQQQGTLPAVVRLTDLGRSFLRWMVDARVSDMRAG